MSYGLSGYSMYKTYVAKDTVTHINLDSNFYRGVNWSNKLADTIDRNFIRWYDFNSHDSTLRYFKVDTIRSNPHVDSIAGNTVITGAPIVTGALTVDSLKSTKGINATGGTFSGRITGSDVEVSDSIKGVTGTFSGALTGTTLNTGNGANELYPMNQAVTTTSDVVFDSTRTRVSVFDSVKLGTGSFLKNYLDTTFYDSLYEGSTYLKRALARIVQIGKIVTLYQPNCYAPASGGFMTLRGLPTKFKPNPGITLSSVVRNNAYITLGQIGVGGTNSYLYLFKSDGSNLDAGDSGANFTCITWIID